MPNRIIREGWIDSLRINQLTPLAERFFLRLILRADDFGRFHAHPLLLKSNLFPLCEDVRNTDISRWLTECEKAGMVRCYEVTNGRYLEITDFRQRNRASKSKFPAPNARADGQTTVNCQTNDGQMTVTCPSTALLGGGGGGGGGEYEGGGGGEGGDANPPSSPPPEPRPPDLHDAHIPTLAEVETCGSMIGATPDTCKRFWQWHEENRAWLSRSGCLVNWQSKLARWRDQDRQREYTGPGSSGIAPTGTSTMSGAEMVIRQKELERIEARIKAINESTDSHVDLSPEERAERRKLKERRELLKRMLGLMC